jgi:hypothetical protein
VILGVQLGCQIDLSQGGNFSLGGDAGIGFNVGNFWMSCCLSDLISEHVVTPSLLGTVGRDRCTAQSDPPTAKQRSAAVSRSCSAGDKRCHLVPPASLNCGFTPPA